MITSDREDVRFWHHPAHPAVELVSARYRRYRFTRHIHDSYTVAVIETGVEEWECRGVLHRAGPGAIGAVNPGDVHTGHSGVPEGWSYRVIRPDVALMTAIAAEVGAGRGAPLLTDAVIDDPVTAERLRAAHRAAAEGDRLASSTLLRTALATLVTRHASGTAAPPPPRRLPAQVRAARDILHAELLDPPSLAELAETVRAEPFALLRAFRAAYGLPPHAYLVQQRVDRARELLRTGARPAEVAAATGFADQAHLSRHFKRITGMSPGVYRRGAGSFKTAEHGPG
ncbi:AraC family transcriptional regulator [Allonocardiopsis opalescens]|uniref:AraC-like DNA-binding protein n=1 Tax=Allonocardiopsis opalescens TaxID=1144618 RepID=A0A2T0Q3X1_9ACTN|nr:AraC family transcriptional regulator [Allonocardiopsis opalescens]PRX98505.1 AraC-like DNA-binding protein [Allonocardiopsis opalescens]